MSKERHINHRGRKTKTPAAAVCGLSWIGFVKSGQDHMCGLCAATPRHCAIFRDLTVIVWRLACKFFSYCFRKCLAGFTFIPLLFGFCLRSLKKTVFKSILKKRYWFPTTENNWRNILAAIIPAPTLLCRELLQIEFVGSRAELNKSPCHFIHLLANFEQNLRKRGEIKVQKCSILVAKWIITFHVSPFNLCRAIDQRRELFQRHPCRSRAARRR